MITPDDETLISTRLPFWQKLTSEEKHSLVSGASAVQYQPHYTLHSGDRNCIGIIILTSGQLRVYMMSPEGRDITLFRISSGDVCVLSAACVLDAISFDVCIDSETQTQAVIISPPAYRRISENNIYVKEFSYELAAERFSEVMWSMQQILFMKFDQRLASFLLDESRRTGSSTIALTHEQIAAYTGSAPEVVSRMLKYFSSDGLVSVSRGSIQITNAERLQKLLPVQQK